MHPSTDLLFPAAFGQCLCIRCLGRRTTQHKPQLSVRGASMGPLAKDVDWPARMALSGSPSWGRPVLRRNAARPALPDKPPQSSSRDRFTAARNEVHGSPERPF